VRRIAHLAAGVIKASGKSLKGDYRTPKFSTNGDKSEYARFGNQSNGDEERRKAAFRDLLALFSETSF
jgi:hypothetical protein